MPKQTIAIIGLSITLAMALAGLAGTIIGSSREYGALVQQVETTAKQTEGLIQDMKAITSDFGETRGELMRIVGWLESEH